MPDDIAGPPPASQNSPSATAPSTVADRRPTITAEADRQTTEAALRLQARFGDADQRRQAADPDGARLPAAQLMALVVSAGSDHRASDADPPRPETGDVLDALRQISRARQELEQQERQVFRLASSKAGRLRGLSWDEIAEALGLDAAPSANQRHRPSIESLVRNARADEVLHEKWKAMSFPPHDARAAEWGECLCERCQEADNRDPG